MQLQVLSPSLDDPFPLAHELHVPLVHVLPVLPVVQLLRLQAFSAVQSTPEVPPGRGKRRERG